MLFKKKKEECTMKNRKKIAKKAIVKAASKSLMTIADIFAGMPCNGRCYEVKVPQSLRK